MARQRYIYREDRDGKVRRIESNVPAIKEDLAELPFEQQMLRAHYTLECEQGAGPSLLGDHSPDTIKKAWNEHC